MAGSPSLWLSRLGTKLGDTFRQVPVVYLGEHTLPFGPKLTALRLATTQP